MWTSLFTVVYIEMVAGFEWLHHRVKIWALVLKFAVTRLCVISFNIGGDGVGHTDYLSPLLQLLVTLSLFQQVYWVQSEGTQHGQIIL